ncbi:glycosyl hydrolase-like protein [Leptomonas pyrrhocoris]|uniref:Glycosyl hydrolase-like protein n=1 Tax=Leptomonas pyrrhocoris TaxID=157538 RepID=A0A0M9G3F6_LEPPY|nr:glycosyl hydrolase-like protein [Leptomonas pyrrhocoris]KPA81447.1 glycosyl hydrolase-like protein [Leptomonas pyrrhocoris]|eukprot:XP_015659886.1 glycosyl hydrolase-like protein [Leptomonas pyrrhocoris]
MGGHRGAHRFTRLWRSRRIMWRATLFLISLSCLSLVGMLLSFFQDNAEFYAEEKHHNTMQPPPQHNNFAGGEDARKTSFLRPAQANTSFPPQPTTSPIPVAESLWFNDAEITGDEGNLGRDTSVFSSDGVARVVFAARKRLHSENETPSSPRLLASDVSWVAYARYAQVHAKTGDDGRPAGPNAPETPQDSAAMRIRPLEQVEVQLLRQRVSRNVWATTDHPQLGAIVGVVPFEPGAPDTTEELLVEQYLRAEDQRKARPDPLRFLSLAAVAARTGGGGDEGRGGGGSSTLEVDTSMDLLKTRALRGANKATSPPPTPLIELRSGFRAKDFTDGAKDDTIVSPTATTLRWNAGGAESENPVTFDVTLDVVHPRQIISDGFNGRGTMDQRESTVNEVFTDALQATVCSARLVRLYGLSPLLLRSQQQDDAGTEAMGGDDFIPLNMREGVEVMVGGRSASSPHLLVPGVVPLLYMELDTGDVPRLPPLSPPARRTVGLLWLHPAPFILSTFTAASAQTCVRLRSTVRPTKLYLLPGPTPADVLRQYYTLTGFPTLPPRFLLGYHHGLRGAAATTQATVEALDASFLHSRTPLDSVWVTDTAVSARDTPFTWNASRFPDPVQLQSNLWYGGRRYVVVRTVPTIPITTHSPLFLEGRRESFFVTMNAEEAVGWPTRSLDGVPSNVVDFTNPSARRWYGNMLKYRRYTGSTNHTAVRLQHAAPLVMADGVPSAALSECALRELSRVGDVLPMEVGHHGSFAHREVHQLLPVDFARAAHEGMLRRTQYVRRAMVLTENYYAGIQRYAVVLVETPPACAEDAATQINSKDTPVVTPGTREKSALAAAWKQLQLAVRQCAQLSTLGIPFSGANLGAGLTREVLSVLLQRQPTEPAMTAAVENARKELEDNDDAKPKLPPQQNRDEGQVPISRAVQPTASHFREAHQLVVRWYQAGVFFPLMYTEEDPTAAAAEQAQSFKYGTGDAAGPWWMRLPVAATTQAAVHANINVRYALVPYLYTVAHNVSENGSSFFAPLPFAQLSPTRGGPATSSGFPTCYAVGEAVVVCPVTRSVSQAAESPTQGKIGTDLFDLWTGVWSSSSVLQTPEDIVVVPAQGRTPLRWLAMTSRRKVPASAADLPTPAFLAPAFLRPGNIIATQNTLLPADEASEGSPLRDDAHTVHSTHMGANWTLTVALPPLPQRTGSTPASQLLAAGDVFWDEGSHNSQQRPPAPQSRSLQLSVKFPVIPHRVNHCALHFNCFYDVREGGTAKLVVEVHQTSDSCAEAVAELQSHWQEQPEGFAQRLSRAKELRDARLHDLELQQNEKEDKGMRVERTTGPLAETFAEEDLNGLRLPRQANEAARNGLWRSHLLHRIRFLFQREEDAAQLIDLSGASNASTVAVERQGTPAETKSETIVSGSAPVSRGSSRSYEVLVDLSACDTSIKGANTAVVSSLAATPLFGVEARADRDGKPALYVPSAYTWRFVFSLK